MIRFDSNRAWDDAMRIVTANREVLMILAGVFFFLPGVLAVSYLTPIQAQLAAIQAKMGSKPTMAELIPMLQLLGQMAPAVALLGLVQIFGRMGMMALVTDQRRPTVGEALGISLKCLPTLIGALLLVVVAYFGSALILGLVAGLLGLAISYVHSEVLTGLLAGVIVGGAVAGILFVFTRLLLLVPVIVMEGERRPLAALKRSWHLVKGNSARVFLFYMLLAVASVVISLVVSFGLNILDGMIGPAGSLIVAIGSALISSVIGVVMMAVLVAMHRQLSDAAPAASAASTSVWGGA